MDLYKLDLKLFQAWRILGDDRQDYQQEAALWITRALETFKPTKGPFVNHLRGYILNTFRDHVKKHKRSAALPDEEEMSDTGTETAHDPLFWKSVKARVTPEQWDLIRLRYHEGKTLDEIAKLKGTYTDKVRAPLMRALNAVKAGSMANTPESPKNVSEIDPVQTCWIPPQHLSDLLGIPKEDIQRYCDPKRDPNKYPIAIDPRDLLRLSRKRLRIRFLENDKGLIYPRFIQRGKTVGQTGYL